MDAKVLAVTAGRRSGAARYHGIAGEEASSLHMSPVGAASDPGSETKSQKLVSQQRKWSPISIRRSEPRQWLIGRT